MVYSLCMKKSLLIAAVTAVTILLAGCSANVDPVETVDPDISTIEAEKWDYEATSDGFAEAFPELDSSGLVLPPNTNIMGNDDAQAWTLGNGNEGFDTVYAWLSAQVELANTAEDTWEGTLDGDDRDVTVVLKSMVIDGTEAVGFTLFVTGVK